jgi:hypothetical protein
MTTHDQNKKTLRHFQCRDYLWEIFEQMSTELECSTDYLINEAMRQYARSRNYGTARSGQANPTTNPQLGELPGSNGIPSLRESAAARSSIPSPPPPPRARTATPMSSAHPTPAPQPPAAAAPAAGGPPAPPPRRTAAAQTGASLPPLPPPPPGRSAPAARQPAVSNPPPLPPGGRGSLQPSASNRSRQLYVIFNGQKIPVTKEEFVIGRGSKSADLAIKDGNISRRHAAVVVHNGAHYLKDLGSTNGVEFQGRRFDSKRIEEGDLFRICDYELRFTYQ